MTPQPQKISKYSGSITSPPSAPGGGFSTTQQPQQEYYCGFKKDVCNLVRPHASTPKFAKDCMCNKYANCTDCQQHDTAIRNVTLDGIIKAINEDIEYEDYCIKTFDTRINRTQKAILSQVVEKIESLRGEP
jgi:hypothetical protein